MKRLPVLLTLGFALHSGLALGDDQSVGVSGSVLGDDVLYSIGGGRAVPMGPAVNMRSLSVGGGWSSNLICGDMSLNTTLQTSSMA